jgi:DNA-binding transcriptional regulator PaaX
MKTVDCEEVLEALGWLFDKLSRPTLGNWLSAYAGYSHHDSARRLFARMERDKLIRHGRSGKELKFTITEQGWARLRDGDPEYGWRRQWDGHWRAITFDVPETRRKDRELLWKALRVRKLGLLQRSIWVWPHELRPIIKDLIRVEGLPECFFGFTTRDIWLCKDAEIVASSWDWEQIGRRQRAYLEQPATRLRALERADSAEKLAQAARAEWRCYRSAFSLDPLLPQRLLPPPYAGRAVQERHQAFRTLLARQWSRLSSSDQLRHTP